jgi:hypothetical protein
LELTPSTNKGKKMITEIKKIKSAGFNFYKVYKTENGKREWIEVYSTLEEAEKHISELTKKPTAKKPSAKITATFSNGFTREYKGNRNVKAAWSIMNKETNETIMSGFSMTRNLAYSSSRNRRRECNELIQSFTGCERVGFPYYQHDLRDRLFPSMREERRLKKENKERLAMIDKMITIEIVDIS